MNKPAIIAITAILLASASSAAHAFDSKRAGFHAGLGLGAHTSTLSNESEFAPDSVESTQKLAVDYQIGYGFSNRIMGFLGGKGGAVLVDDGEATLAINGVGGTIYWSDTAPSLYLTGVVGLGVLAMEDEDVDLNDTGAGWLAGIGFEVAKGLHLELSYARADLVDPENDTNKTALESTFATIKYVWY